MPCEGGFIFSPIVEADELKKKPKNYYHNILLQIHYDGNAVTTLWKEFLNVS